MHAIVLGGLIAAIGAAVLYRLEQDRRQDHDAAITRMDSAPFPGCIRVSRDQAGGELPLPVRVPGAALDWEGHVAAALAVARAAVASDFAEWEAQISDEGAAA